MSALRLSDDGIRRADWPNEAGERVEDEDRCPRRSGSTVQLAQRVDKNAKTTELEETES